MSDAATERVRLGDLSDLRDGDMRSCPIGSTDVLVCRAHGQLYAIEDLCSHADTILSDGFLSGYVVTCSLHGAQFDVRTGKHLSPPAYTGVRTFDLEETAEGVSVVVRPREDRPSGPETGYFQTR